MQADIQQILINNLKSSFIIVILICLYLFYKFFLNGIRYEKETL